MQLHYLFLKRLFGYFLFVIGICTSNVWAVGVPFDPFFWLEEISGEHSQEWVKQQNSRTTQELESYPNYQNIYNDIKNILFAEDRVPFSSYYKGYFWNFWQDEKNQHGILRRTTLEEYKKAQATWEVMIDFDDLSKVENENWVYKGSQRLEEGSKRALISLSRGGKDATVIREFDFEARQFIIDGFNVPEAKTVVTPLDENQILIGSDFGKDLLTTSGYPRIIKRWKRGQPLSEAKIIFEVKLTDISAGASKIHDDNVNHVLLYRAVDFFNTEIFLLQKDDSIRKLPIPSSATLLSIKGNQIYILLKEEIDSKVQSFPSNSIVRFDLNALNLDHAQLIYTSMPGQSIQSVEIKKDEIFVNLLDNIRSKVLKLKLNSHNEWVTKVLPFPQSGVINLALKDDDDPSDISLMTYTDHLTPPSQYLIHSEDDSYRLELLKNAPARFDASKFEVIQNFSKSSDGVQIPYFVIKPKDMILDGSNPTLLYGYGGFEVSLTPSYSAIIGKVWLERGGVYVIANIRGGGEFGPQWHQAAKKTHRQIAFDDFISVAEDLISKGITSRSHLGIRGESNGGLLVGVAMVQRPDLFQAVLSKVPLLDMLNFSKLLAGASWIGEYGDPAVSQEGDYLIKYSPYHNIRPGTHYPRPLFITSTKDDRVHPGHARKMSARMSEQGHSFLYYENVNGGHAGSANLEEMAHMTAMEYSYFWNSLKTGAQDF